MGIERHRELRRRRSRRKKVSRLKLRSEGASPSEKINIANKLRDLTPGAETLIARLGLEDRN